MYSGCAEKVKRIVKISVVAGVLIIIAAFAGCSYKVGAHNSFAAYANEMRVARKLVNVTTGEREYILFGRGGYACGFKNAAVYNLNGENMLLLQTDIYLLRSRYKISACSERMKNFAAKRCDSENLSAYYDKQSGYLYIFEAAEQLISGDCKPVSAVF